MANPLSGIIHARRRPCFAVAPAQAVPGLGVRRGEGPPDLHLITASPTGALSYSASPLAFLTRAILGLGPAGAATRRPILLQAELSARRSGTGMCRLRSRGCKAKPAVFALLHFSNTSVFEKCVVPLGNCSCVTLGCCSWRNSTSSFPGVVPSDI